MSVLKLRYKLHSTHVFFLRHSSLSREENSFHNGLSEPSRVGIHSAAAAFRAKLTLYRHHSHELLHVSQEGSWGAKGVRDTEVASLDLARCSSKGSKGSPGRSQPKQKMRRLAPSRATPPAASTEPAREHELTARTGGLRWDSAPVSLA